MRETYAEYRARMRREAARRLVALPLVFVLTLMLVFLCLNAGV